MTVAFDDAGPKYTTLSGVEMEEFVTSSWASYKYTFTATTTDATARIVFNLGMAANPLSVKLDNIGVYQGSSCPAGGSSGSSSSSSSSAAPSQACSDPAFILCEDFEKVAVNAIPSGWTITGARRTSVVTTGAHSGTHSLKASTAGFNQSGFIEHTGIPAAHYGRMYYRFDTLTSATSLHIPMVILHKATNGQEVRVVDVNSPGQGLSGLKYQVNFPDDSGASSTAFTSFTAAQQAWQCVEWQSDPASQTYKVWVNGTQRILYNTGNLIPATSYTRLSLGMITFTNTEESAWIDDFALSTKRIGCN